MAQNEICPELDLALCFSRFIYDPSLIIYDHKIHNTRDFYLRLTERVLHGIEDDLARSILETKLERYRPKELSQ